MGSDVLSYRCLLYEVHNCSLTAVHSH